MPAKLTPCIGLLVLVAVGCTSAAPPPTGPSISSETDCERLISHNPTAFKDRLFRSEYLYACHLAEAFQHFVSEKQACAQDSDCVFVRGDCRVGGAWVNRRYEDQVTAVRDKVLAAYHVVSACSACGGLGTPTGPTCRHWRCE
jgi:hypothetical protein